MKLFSSPATSLPAGGSLMPGHRFHKLLLDDDATLTINEVRCPEPGCPDLETVIGISCAPGRWRRLRVPRPVADVTREDLRIAAQDLLTEMP